MTTTTSNTCILSDVTPYWWHGHWATRKSNADSTALIRRSLQVILSMTDVDNVTVSGGGVEVRFTVGLRQEASELQDRADALRAFLDDLVPPLPRVACAN